MQIIASIVIYKPPKKDLQTVVTRAANSIVDTIYIVDNAPNDNFKEFAQSLSEKVVYIQGYGNIGYGAAHNIAIKASIAQRSKYHLVLNPDVEFEQDVVEKLVEFMDDNPIVGLVMPKILYPNGDIQHLCKLLPTPADLIFRRFLAFTSWAKKRKEKYELQTMNYEQAHFDIPSLSGCFMLFNTEVLEKIMGFDDRYFLYMEDTDLCRRAHQVSKTAFYPAVSVVHNYAKGSYKNYKLLRYHICSAVKYFNKWGWFFDAARKKVNKKMLQELNHNSE
jgi:GT2 family glycosyltransferase